MKCTIKIDENREEEVLIFAHEKNSLVEEIENLCLNKPITLIGYKGKHLVKLLPNEIYCFVVENNKVYAEIAEEKIPIKQRLYELENILDDSFVKINQSCIVNVNKILRFEASFGGALMVKLKNGYHDYVSRRQVKAVKERLGL